jgi:hypothetical protein
MEDPPPPPREEDDMPKPPAAKLPRIDPDRIIVPLKPRPGVDFEERMVECCALYCAPSDASFFVTRTHR